jgi:hypothetical protein
MLSPSKVASYISLFAGVWRSSVAMTGPVLIVIWSAMVRQIAGMPAMKPNHSAPLSCNNYSNFIYNLISYPGQLISLLENYILVLLSRSRLEM